MGRVLWSKPILGREVASVRPHCRAVGRNVRRGRLCAGVARMDPEVGYIWTSAGSVKEQRKWDLYTDDAEREGSRAFI